MPLLKSLFLPALAGGLCATLSACASFGSCGSAACAADTRISAAVASRLDERPALKADQVSVQTINHVVYLNGTVDTNSEKREAQEVAGAVPGVSEVVNKIGVLNDSEG